MLKAAVIEIPLNNAQASLTASLAALNIAPDKFLQAIVLSTESTNNTAKIVIFYQE